MANISHFTQTVNGISTTYDIHDANAIPRSGGEVLAGQDYKRTVDNNTLNIYGGKGYGHGAFLQLTGKDDAGAGEFNILAHDGTNAKLLKGKVNGTLTWGSKNVAMQEDVIPRSGGGVLTGTDYFKITNNSYICIGGGTNWGDGATITFNGATRSTNIGQLILTPNNGTYAKDMCLEPNGTWTWNGTACQITSDQRLKQQIAEIDDKLLDAWESVELCQFKYNDAVDAKKDKARLHTGYVVQQIDKACKEHDVDISAYGLFCHEEYPEETEEVEVEQEDGTKTKERKVIREANEHYSLRYTEVYAIECMYLRRCISRLVARIEELEKGNKEVEK